MKVIQNWENIQEAEEFNRLKPGGYVVVIKNVEDDANKECLKVSFDIHEGEFKDYYLNLYKSKNFWAGNFFRSYKESAQSFFKGFITAIEKSNPTYRWNWNEQTLKGKVIGVVLQEEEYTANNGEVKVRLIVQETRSVDEIRKGNYTVKDKKLLNPGSQSVQTTNQSFASSFDIMDDDIQF